MAKITERTVVSARGRKFWFYLDTFGEVTGFKCGLGDTVVPIADFLEALDELELLDSVVAPVAPDTVRGSVEDLVKEKAKPPKKVKVGKGG